VVRYDPVGLGSSGGDLSRVEFSHWVDSARIVLDQLGDDKNVLVGKSICEENLKIKSLKVLLSTMF